MRVAFLTKDLQLSGGVGVVVTHARNLATEHGFDVTLVLTDAQEDAHWDYEQLPHLHVIELADALDARFDIAVSTWWETAYSLFQLNAKRYASFVQSLEDRFYEGHESIERLAARLTLDLPVSFITEAEWIAEALTDLRPETPVHLVRNGIDKQVFSPVRSVPRHDGPLRVMIEGAPDSWFKGVGHAINAVKLMREPYRLTLVCPNRDGLAPEDAAIAIGPLTPAEMAHTYEDCDVLLKLSRVEGMYGPPLEAFHKGATCITTEVTGHGEYIRHGVNALVVDWDDDRGAAAQLDLLARDHELLAKLRGGALETAKDWPDWSASSSEMAVAVTEIIDSDRPDAYAAMPQMLTTLRIGLEHERGARGYYRKLRADAGRWQRVNSLPVIGHLLAARRSLKARQSGGR